MHPGVSSRSGLTQSCNKPSVLSDSIIVLLGLLVSGLSIQARTFTSEKGQVIEDEFESANEETVTIVRLADGKKYNIPISSLSDAEKA